MAKQLHRPFRYLDTVQGDRYLPLFRITGGSPSNGTSGDFAGVAPAGSILLTDEPAVYENQGTQASPTWTAIPFSGGNASFASLTATGGFHGIVPALAGATKTLTAANANGLTLLDQASGSVVTLPAATGTGDLYRFAVKTTTSSAAHKILAASSSDNMIGFV